MSGDAETQGNDHDATLPRIELPDPAMIEILRCKTPVERLAMVFDAERTIWLMLEAHLQSLHPDWDAQQIGKEIARRRSLASG